MKRIAWGKLRQVKSWAPFLLGVAAGVAGGAWVIDQVRAWVASTIGGDDLWDWAARGGLTFAGLLMWLSAGGRGPMGQGIQGAALGFAVVGALGLIQKAAGIAPTSIRALRPATLAARPVVVTRTESTPAYGAAGATPAY